MLSTRKQRVERVNTGTVVGVDNRILEVETNTVFTDYIAENYERLMRETCKFGIDPEMAGDLINDVWKSYKEDEANGNCYDMSKGNRDGLVSAEQSVYGRIKRYAMNNKYRKQNEAPMYNTTSGKYVVKEIAASFTSDDLDEMTDCQKQYALMNSYDDLDTVEDRLSLAENIQYLLTFESKLPVINVIDVLIKMRNNLANIDMSIFKEFREAGKEFREAFTVVFKTAMKDPDFFAVELDKAKKEFYSLKDVIA